jgi:hypothetical protein
MPPKPSRGGRIGVSGSGSAPLVRLGIRVEGVDRTTDEFKRIRRDINTALRDAMQRAGERTVVPAIKSALPRKDPSVKGGLPSGAMASSIAVKRDRLDVQIKSTLPKNLDRALGWVDFGGQRPRDTKVRVGPHVIVSTLDAKSDAIDQAVLDELAVQFRDFDFHRGG